MANDCSDDSLLVAIFKEIAVVRGTRTADGTWLDAKSWDVQKALQEAILVVNGAKAAAGAPAAVSAVPKRGSAKDV